MTTSLVNTRKDALIFHWCSMLSLDNTTVYLLRVFSGLHFAQQSICDSLGVGTPKNGAYDAEIRTQPRFCTMHLPTKFHYLIFNYWEVSYHVDKQTHPQRFCQKHLRYASLCFATPVEIIVSAYDTVTLLRTLIFPNSKVLVLFNKFVWALFQ